VRKEKLAYLISAFSVADLALAPDSDMIVVYGF
jgi:hypothetical protein